MQSMHALIQHPTGKPYPCSCTREKCHPLPLLAGRNFSKLLSTSISSFGHPTTQLSHSFHSHDAHRKCKHLGARVPSRGPSLTRTGAYVRETFLLGSQAFKPPEC